MSWTWDALHPLLTKEDSRRRSLVSDKVEPMYPPLGYVYKTRAGLVQEITFETPRLPSIKTKAPRASDVVYQKGTPKYTPNQDRSRTHFTLTSPRSPGSARSRGTPNSARSNKSSRLFSPGRSPRGRGLSQNDYQGKSQRGRTKCSHCHILGHRWYDKECPEYDPNRRPDDDTPHAKTAGGKKSSSK